MLLTTTESVPGHTIVEVLGMVRGSSVRSRDIFRDFTEWVRNLVGSELGHYTKMMAEAREQALDRMKDQARMLGADAVIGVQLEATSMTKGAAEIFAYGTAVKFGGPAE